MASAHNPYMPFYLEAREEKLLRATIDVEALAEQVLEAGADKLHSLIRAAAVNAAMPLEVDKKKRAWIADHEDAIADVGGDKEAAHRNYVLGRVDDLVQSLENEVVEAMNDLVFGEDEDEDEDDEDDDEDEDDDDDDEDGEDNED